MSSNANSISSHLSSDLSYDSSSSDLDEYILLVDSVASSLSNNSSDFSESSSDPSESSSDVSSSSSEPIVHQQPIMAAPNPIVKKSLSIWATSGLDLSDSGFSKLHSKESTFPEDKSVKYDLEPEKFEAYKQNLIEKINRIHSKLPFQATDDTTKVCDVLTEYSRLTEANIITARDQRWPDIDPVFQTQAAADVFTDDQLKTSTVGNYINGSLTDNAKNQLRADQSFYEVKDSTGNIYFDGPSFFWKLADLVDPDNGHLIENVRKQLRTLSIKDFGYSIITMLAEFKNLKRKIAELGGTYDDDAQYLDFWDAIRTMKEKKFARYAEMERDSFRKKSKATRGPIENYIRDFNQKEIAMKSDNEWNVMSPEDAMVMALVTMMDKDSKKKVKNNNNDKETLSDAEKQKRRDAKIPEWKKKAPKEGDPTSVTKDDKTYHWCLKCREGKGLWALHEQKDHKSDFTPRSQRKDKDKTVAFAAGTKVDDETTSTPAPTSYSDAAKKSSSKPSTDPSIQVKKDLLNNVKAYLAQYSDFQEGGTQGE